MNTSEIDINPSIEFRNQLKSTLNRLSNQYLCLLKAGSSEVALSDLQVDPRGKYGILVIYIHMLTYIVI